MALNNSLPVAVVVGLVVVAGCGGFGGSGPAGTETTADTVGSGGDGAGGTESSMTTAAPGIGESGTLVSVSALYDAHRAAMNASGFTYRFENRKITRAEFPDQEDTRTVEIDVVGRVAAEAGLSPYLVNETDRATDPVTRTVQYVGPDGGAQRTLRGGNETVEPYSEAATVLLTTHYLMKTLISNGDWTVENRRSDAVVLKSNPSWSEGKEREEEVGLRTISTRTRLSGTMVVSRDGVIRRLSVNQTAVERVEENGSLQSTETTTRLFEFELLQTDGTQIERPSWVSVARNETTTPT
jgi:hypothetical protein